MQVFVNDHHSNASCVTGLLVVALNDKTINMYTELI